MNRLLPAAVRGGFLILATLVFLQGCGSHRGELSLLQESREPDRNYRTVKSVTGTASTISIFGIRDRKWNLYDRARRKLIDKADLASNQRLINWTLDERVAGFPPTSGSQSFIDPILGLFQVYTRKTVYLSGEVVEITKE